MCHVLRANRGITIRGEQCLRHVSRRDAIAFEQPRSVDHHETGRIDTMLFELFEHYGHSPRGGSRPLCLRTHDLEKHLGSEIVAPLPNASEKRAERRRRHLANQRKSVGRRTILDREPPPKTGLFEGAHQQACRIRLRIRHAAAIVQGSSLLRDVALDADVEAPTFGEPVIDAWRWRPACSRHAAIVNLDILVRQHPNASRLTDLRPWADVHDVAVAVDCKGRDRCPERGGLVWLLIECRRKDAIVEVAVSDQDAIDYVDASQAQALGKRSELGVPEARITGRPDDQGWDLPVIDAPLDPRVGLEAGSEAPKRRSGGQKLLIGRRISGALGLVAVEFLGIMQPNDVNPDTIAETCFEHEARDRLGQRPGISGPSAMAQDQKERNQAEEKRSVRHRLKPSSGLLWLLVIGLGCARAPERDPDALVIMLPRDAEQLDPRFVGDPYGLRVSRLLFASLVTIDPRTLEAIPDLAESVTPKSPTEFLVKLKPNLSFSDGSVLDAEDVVATFEGVVDPALRSRYAHTYRRIAEMRVVDPLTVVFVLSEPHATFLTDLELPIVRSEDAHRRIATPEDPFPVGAGPYLLVKRDPGVLELRANPRWHRGTPFQPSLRLVVIRDDNTRALRMLAGEGDLALASIPPLLLPMFEDDDRFEIRSAPGISTMYIGFQTQSEKLSDVRVRHAIGHALNRELLVRTKYHGLAQVTDSWIPIGHWAAVDGLPTHAFDPPRARALLDEAGFVDPPGDAPRMSLVLRTTSERFRQSVARAIAAMLRDVGIEVDVRPSETATLISDLNRGRFEITLLQVPEVIEPHVLSWFFDSSRIPSPETEGANRWRYSNASLDALFELGRTRIGRVERRAAYEEAQRVLARDLPVLPLWQPDTVAVVRHGSDFDVPRDGRFGTLAF
jgi:peptide/nickel transport system substrate-binding protein